MVLVISNAPLGLRASYNVADIEKIEYGNGIQLGYTEGDLAGNDITPTEAMIKISFKDGELASFASGWAIRFE